MAIGGVAALAAVVLVTTFLSHSDEQPLVPPFAEPMDDVDPMIPVVEDLSTHPSFHEAHATVCEQTISGLDNIFAAESAVADLITTIESEYHALSRRIDNVYSREDLWDATDPLVLEYAEAIVDDLASILDGSDIGLSYLEGDVALFRSLCDDWSTPT